MYSIFPGNYKERRGRIEYEERDYLVLCTSVYKHELSDPKFKKLVESTFDRDVCNFPNCLELYFYNIPGFRQKLELKLIPKEYAEFPDLPPVPRTRREAFEAKLLHVDNERGYLITTGDKTGYVPILGRPCKLVMREYPEIPEICGPEIAFVGHKYCKKYHECMDLLIKKAGLTEAREVGLPPGWEDISLSNLVYPYEFRNVPFAEIERKERCRLGKNIVNLIKRKRLL